ncbi:hypothetical protein HHL11_04005 [Ramlibacter sp. G-1-2-2]|uniref:Ferritin-like domain-containing protein n=1 Tax=Ramlibacter agri TaxID=2728837 RepID=A0A848GZU2_9BURK|nr:hypothetical protein [Ramlibacter agri]NML42901.1 hypothetical protein [Ramlibacter agri]
MLDTASPSASRTQRYAKCIELSKHVRWDIENDVIRGRHLDYSRKFLPDSLSRMEHFGFTTDWEKVLISQIQGRTYANMLALVERYIGAMMLDRGRSHALGDLVAMEALVRLTDEELKHQALFRRLEAMMAAGMPPGYHFDAHSNEVAGAVLARGDWSVLALTCLIELATVAHYRQCIDEDPLTSELWRDVFRFHMREEMQHALLDELEWQREDFLLSAAEREQGVTDLVDLLQAQDALLQQQAQLDACYFMRVNGRRLSPQDTERLREGFLAAYRWQYMVSGMGNERFCELLASLCTPAQVQRLRQALAPVMND